MAKLVKGILGGFRGKLGTVVGTIWKGITVVRAYTAQISNPKTPAQLEHREKFKTAMAFLKPLTSFIRLSYRQLAIGITTYNAAFKQVLDEAVMGAYPNFEIDYSKVLVAQGGLTPALNPTITSIIAGEIEFAWDDNSGDGNAMANDVAMLVVYNPTRKQAITSVVGGTRSGGVQTFTLPSSFTGDEVQTYLAFKKADGSLVSNSAFAGEIVVA